jgi:hypothetical protein
MFSMSSIFTIASDTNVWDALIIVAAASVLLVGSAGGIVALTEKPECHVGPNANAAVCCGREAPPRLLPLLAIIFAFIMEGFVVVKRIALAPKLDQFGREAREMARDDNGGGSKLDNLVINAMTSAMVHDSAQSLHRCAWAQVSFACLLFATPFALLCPRLLGSAVMVGGQLGKVGDYYTFTCPAFCSQLDNATAFDCYTGMESPALFWSLVVSLFLFVIGSVLFWKFTRSFEVESESVDVVHETALILVAYAAGDKRDVVFTAFAKTYREERSLPDATKFAKVVKVTYEQLRTTHEAVREAIGPLANILATFRSGGEDIDVRDHWSWTVDKYERDNRAIRIDGDNLHGLHEVAVKILAVKSPQDSTVSFDNLKSFLRVCKSIRPSLQSMSELFDKGKSDAAEFKTSLSKAQDSAKAIEAAVGRLRAILEESRFEEWPQPMVDAGTALVEAGAPIPALTKLSQTAPNIRAGTAPLSDLKSYLADCSQLPYTIEELEMAIDSLSQLHEARDDKRLGRGFFPELGASGVP